MRPLVRSLPVILPAFAFAVSLGASASEAWACGVINVNSNGDHPDIAPGDGNCATQWGFCSLRAAIMESNACAGTDTITVPVGTSTISLYTFGINDNLAHTGDLDIIDDVILYGNGVVIDGMNDDRIFHVLNGVAADIHGVTLINGWGGPVGGAIYNQGDLTLTSCALHDNAATDEGGAIKNISAGSLVMTDCDVHSNEADRGGAIYSNTDLEITDSDIFANEAYGWGGGLLINDQGSTAEITDTYIGDNIAGQWGGGIATWSPVDLLRSTISLNVAGDYGGGLYLSGSAAVVDAFKSDVSGNVADHGAGIFNFRGDLVLRRVGVFANHATTSGGGVRNEGTMVALRGAVHDNTAAAGAGIYNYWFTGDLTLVNMTLSGNDATGLGGGLYVQTNSAADLNNVTITDNVGLSGGLEGQGSTTMSNTILASNLDLTGAPSDCVGSMTSDGHNLIEDTAGCTISGPATADIYATAPGLDPLANNGGRTPTHAVQAGSAALDAGDNATCQPVDQRGVARPQGGACEIGAYEQN